MIKDSITFDIKVTGELSGQELEGVFDLKTKLSAKERFKEDELRRAFLGINAAEASNEAFQLASVLAFLRVRTLKAPKWWTEASYGGDIEDMNVIEEVNKLACEAIAAEYKKLTDKATDAQKSLKAELNK